MQIYQPDPQTQSQLTSNEAKAQTTDEIAVSVFIQIMVSKGKALKII